MKKTRQQKKTTTIKINKRDNLLINDHQRTSLTSTSPSKALVLTMQPSMPWMWTLQRTQRHSSRCSLHCRQFELRVALAIILEPLHLLLRRAHSHSQYTTHTHKTHIQLVYIQQLNLCLSFYIFLLSFIFSLFMSLLHHFILFQLAMIFSVILLFSFVLSLSPPLFYCFFPSSSSVFVLSSRVFLFRSRIKRQFFGDFCSGIWFKTFIRLSEIVIEK